MQASKVKARELMQSEVVRLDAGTLVDEAISLFESDRIGGAPVVDSDGRVVGVISMSDMARAKDSEAHTPGSMRSEFYMPEEGMDEEADEFEYKEDYSPAALPTGTIAEWMSEDIVSVSPEDSVRIVCNRMATHGIHRVLVLEEGQLVGILTSFDVVRWIAEHG